MPQRMCAQGARIMCCLPLLLTCTYLCWLPTSTPRVQCCATLTFPSRDKRDVAPIPAAARPSAHEPALYGCPHQMMDLLDGPSIVDIDRGTPTGSTPLTLVAQEGRSGTVRVLLEEGANMSIAAQQGHLAVVVDLLKAEAEMGARIHHDDSPPPR